MNSNVRNAVLWLIVLCLVVLVWAVFRHPANAGKTPQFSDLYRDVQDGKVEQATFNATTGDVSGEVQERRTSSTPPCHRPSYDLSDADAGQGRHGTAW